VTASSACSFDSKTMTDMPIRSIGANQYALTKPGALGTKFNLRPANALRATSGSSILTVATTAYIGQVFPARGAESMSTLLRITRPALLRDRLTARARREPDRDVSGLERTMNDIGQITLQRVNVNGLAQPRSEGGCNRLGVITRDASSRSFRSSSRQACR
jgi:hypothetical protein